MMTVLCFFAILFSLKNVYCYKPIILMHGIDGSDHDWDEFIGRVNKYHPGTETYPLSCYNNLYSWSPMIPQAQCIIGAIYDIKCEHPESFKDGFNLVCHSQGALSCRVVLQMMKDHGVFNFLSFSGPQLGEYGIPELDDFLPNLIRNMTFKEITKLVYSDSFLKNFAFSQYWHSVDNHERYLTENVYLPIMNNETFNKDASEYKTNFLSIKNNIILFGSPHDKVIQPYFSAFFSFYKDGSMKEVVDMKDQYVYLHDTFGLRTLDSQGRVIMHSVDQVEHTGWLYREDLFVKYIEQYLV